MPNGSKGDHPLTDMLIHGLHPFPADIEAMLRELFDLDPNYLDTTRRHVDQLAWWNRFEAWERGERLDEGRKLLSEILQELRAQK